MPASAIVSETEFLKVIWMGSLGLSLASLAVVVIVVIRRIIIEKRRVYIHNRRQEITQCFYAALRSTVQLTVASFPKMTAKDKPIIMRAALDTLRSLRGSDTRRIVELLELWGMPAYLDKIAESGRKGKRIQAMTLLGYFHDEASIRVLLKGASDRDMYIQIAALRGLAMRGAVEHINDIVEHLTKSGQTNTPMLSDILHRFGEPVVQPLITLANSNANSEVRTAAVMALGAIGSLNAVNTLIALADDADIDICAQSIAALGKIGDNRAAQTITRHLQSAEVAVRVQAAQALGGMHYIACLPQLAACLSDSDWWVRFRAAESLYKFGDKGIAALKAISAQQTPAGVIAKQVLAEFSGGM